MSARDRNSALSVAVVYPDLLGTYGDGGNGLVLARRAAWRGVAVELVQADSGRPLPSADLYCIGGGEDGPEVRAAEALRADRRLPSAPWMPARWCSGSAPGSSCSAGRSPIAPAAPTTGLALLDVTTAKGGGPRAVGELVAEAAPDGPRLPGGGHLPALTGFENHGATTRLGGGARALARVVTESGTAPATARRAPGPTGSSAPTSTGRCWPATSPSPTCSSVGRWPRPGSEPVPLEPLDDGGEDALRGERLSSTARPARLAGRRRR